MARSHLSVTISCVVVAACCLTGCPTPQAPAPAPPSGSGGAQPAAAPAPGGGELTVTSYTDLGNSTMQMASNPDDAALEKLVRGMDWKNPQLRPYVHLARIAGNSGSYLRLQGTQ